MERPPVAILTALAAGLAIAAVGTPARAQSDAPRPAYGTDVRPVVGRLCLDCHSTKAKKGGLDLERFASVEAARKDLKAWSHVLEQVEAGEMPPRGKPQPTADERRRVV